jgi:hypothetical protein
MISPQEHVLKLFLMKLNISLIIYMTLGSESMLLFEKHYYNSVTPACELNGIYVGYKISFSFSASYCGSFFIRWKWKIGSEPL